MNQKRAVSTVGQKAVVSVSDMARAVGLSRSRFHELVRSGAMPQPIRCPRTQRPMYTRELQQQALAVRETNVGADGSYVVFYGRRTVRTPPPASAPVPAKPDPHAALADGLQALGMSDATPAAIAAAVAECFPDGTTGVDQGVVLRSVWTHLRQPKSS